MPFDSCSHSHQIVRESFFIKYSWTFWSLETHERAESFATTARGYLAARSASSYVARGREREGEGEGGQVYSTAGNVNTKMAAPLSSPITDLSLSSAFKHIYPLENSPFKALIQRGCEAVPIEWQKENSPQKIVTILQSIDSNQRWGTVCVRGVKLLNAGQEWEMARRSRWINLDSWDFHALAPVFAQSGFCNIIRTPQHILAARSFKLYWPPVARSPRPPVRLTASPSCGAGQSERGTTSIAWPTGSPSARPAALSLFRPSKWRPFPLWIRSKASQDGGTATFYGKWRISHHGITGGKGEENPGLVGQN